MKKLLKNRFFRFSLDLTDLTKNSNFANRVFYLLTSDLRCSDSLRLRFRSTPKHCTREGNPSPPAPPLISASWLSSCLCRRWPPSSLPPSSSQRLRRRQLRTQPSWVASSPTNGDACSSKHLAGWSSTSGSHLPVCSTKDRSVSDVYRQFVRITVVYKTNCNQIC